MLGVRAVVFGVFNRSDPDRARLAKPRASNLSGPNAGVVLAALAVSQLYYSLAFFGSTAWAGVGSAAAIGLILVIVGLHRRGERAVELLGVVAFVALMFIHEGVDRGIFFLVVAVAVLIVLSMPRFVTGK